MRSSTARATAVTAIAAAILATPSAASPGSGVDHKLLATSKTSTMQKRMSAAAAYCSAARA